MMPNTARERFEQMRRSFQHRREMFRFGQALVGASIFGHPVVVIIEDGDAEPDAPSSAPDVAEPAAASAPAAAPTEESTTP